jgi:hypothetical protein
MRIACSATGNSMEAGAGLILREDPRYFRVPNPASKASRGKCGTAHICGPELWRQLRAGLCPLHGDCGE